MAPLVPLATAALCAYLAAVGGSECVGSGCNSQEGASHSPRNNPPPTPGHAVEAPWSTTAQNKNQAVEDEQLTLPEPPAGYSIYAKGNKFCRGRKVYNDRSTGLHDCLRVCDTFDKCMFASYWVSTGWCRLSEQCTGSFSSVKIVNVYEKVEDTSAGVCGAGGCDQAEDDVMAYELLAEESKCLDDAINETMTAGVEECGRLCNATLSCKFFSVYMGGWCSLTETCSKITDPGDHIHADIYELARGEDGDVTESSLAPGSTDYLGCSVKVTGMIRGAVHVMYESTLVSQLQACAPEVDDQMIHHDYAGEDPWTDSVTIWLARGAAANGEATRILDSLNKCDFQALVGDTLKDLMDIHVETEISKMVTVPAPEEITAHWCCLTSYMYDDPCSECTPSLTPRVATTEGPCGLSKSGCMTCKLYDWVDPVWCRL